MTEESANLVGDGVAGRYRYALGRDLGVVRENQEDAFVFLDNARTSGHGLVFIVSDGMGGEEAGEIASYLICNTTDAVYGALRVDGLSALDALQASIEQGNQAILTYAAENHRKGMGCTVVALALDEEGAWLAHVGDSRAYVMTDNQLVRVTRDHTRVQRLVDEGILTPEEAEGHPESNVLSQALGRERMVVDRNLDRAWPPTNCAWLLCSDGLTGMVPDELLHLAIETLEPRDGVEALIDICRQLGAHDNVTIAILRDGPLARPLALAEFYGEAAELLDTRLALPGSRDQEVGPAREAQPEMVVARASSQAAPSPAAPSPVDATHDVAVGSASPLMPAAHSGGPDPTPAPRKYRLREMHLALIGFALLVFFLLALLFWHRAGELDPPLDPDTEVRPVVPRSHSEVEPPSRHEGAPPSGVSEGEVGGLDSQESGQRPTEVRADSDQSRSAPALDDQRRREERALEARQDRTSTRNETDGGNGNDTADVADD